ncbi:MAG: Molybdate transporter substrate-binding protein [Candidatus Brocadiaceae bacterium]|nr:Molybdate transporter substrate-binding protein [Candidatus Brocadiaceae bacterium]
MFIKTYQKKMAHLVFTAGIVLLAILFACLPYRAQGGEKILIAAASDLNFAMDEMLSAFGKAHPTVDVDVSYGSSGNFYAQIKQGAPYDIFFSADASYPARLEEEGFSVKGQQRLYAIGQIVLWIPGKSSLDPQKGLEVVLKPAVKKLAIANPKHAPYGRAAEESLRYYGVLDKVRDKLVFGENISQAAQFAQTGAADAGIIALSLAISPKMARDGTYWVIPESSHNKLEQSYTVLQRGKDKPGVKSFLEFVQSKNGRKILSDFGFVLPGCSSGLQP